MKQLDIIDKLLNGWIISVSYTLSFSFYQKEYHKILLNNPKTKESFDIKKKSFLSLVRKGLLKSRDTVNYTTPLIEHLKYMRNNSHSENIIDMDNNKKTMSKILHKLGYLCHKKSIENKRCNIYYYDKGVCR